MINQCHFGDCRDVLQRMHAGGLRAQMCVTSPPYWGLRDYGTGTWEGGDPECQHRKSELRRGMNLADSPATTRGGGKKIAEAGWIQYRGVCAECGAVRADSGRKRGVGHPSGRNCRSVWRMATVPYRGAHFAVFPPALAQRCILAGSRPGDVILDPFIGSGTTAMVAQRLGRKWIGIDLQEKNAALQAERLSGTMGLAV